MKKRKLDRIFAWITLLLFLMACLIPGVPVAPTQTIEVFSKEDLGTIIVQTADAAQAETASALPSPTRTFTPTWTPSTTPTSTPTFLYLLPTATPIPTQTTIPTIGSLVVGGNGTQGVVATSVFTDKPWTCLVTGSTPPRTTIQKPNKEFYVTWTVMNTGTKEWWNNGIDFIYLSGYRTEQRPIQDLPKTLYSGGSITLKILLLAPKRPDTYTAIWGLRVGHLVFCRMKIVFKVGDQS